MNWQPAWKRRSKSLADSERRRMKIVNKGYMRWFAWRPVTANYSTKIQYWDSERRVWLEWIERRLVTTSSDGFKWQYHIEKPEEN